MTIVTDYLHALDGRLRIKVPELKGSSGHAASIQKHLETRYGIQEVHANPTTGNVLIIYNPDLITQNDIIRALKDDLGYFRHASHDPASPSRQGEGVTGAVVRAFMESALQTVVMALI